MSRVFVVGTGPLMDGGARRVTAHARRTWHFVSALRAAGHDVALCTVSQNISPADAKEHLVQPRNKDGFAYENLDMRMGNMLAYLAERTGDFQPDCVVGVTTEPAAWASRMRPTVPVWADLHGWVMAEAQLKAAVDDSDDVLAHFWRYERPVLRRADKISVVSSAQRFAVIGELATLGRLNRHNVNHELVEVIPGSVGADFVAEPADVDVVRREVGSDDAFVVLWSGAFNTWTDPATLVEALDWAMARDRTIHFIATGGAVPGHADSVFDRFRAHVERSPHRARYHVLGWVAAEQFPGILAGSHLAVCTDFPCVETSVGTRTRLLEAMRRGLPVAMTRGTELSVAVEREGVGWIVAPRDPQALGECIVQCAGAREATARMGEKARAFVEGRYSITQTMASLVRWAERPAFAPDNEVKRAESPTIFEAALNPLDANARALDDVDDVASLREAQRDLERLRSRWPLRFWRRLRR
jgi:glycosyltransferase involved in cell wall biosynthesis